MKEQKEYKITVRLNETQHNVLQKIIDEGKAKSISTALQYLLNQHALFDK
ncbi:hypothetical protein K8D15_07250 [Citrobacter youngae]|nr:hypothetical protein [Citrobacter youngae]MCO4162984.1 hypothetical protein [Citrobacter youngae]